MRAIHTTLTALGTRAAYCPKWSFARRKPKALRRVKLVEQEMILMVLEAALE